MKKYYIGLALICAAGLMTTSCDMEKYPENAIEESKYLKSVEDFENIKIGIYSQFRGLTTGSFVTSQEIQCDDFNATNGFSNTLGSMYRWDFQSSEGTMETFWGNYYSAIARCNYVIDGYNKVLDGSIADIDDEGLATISQIAGEAFFTRAFCYYNLSLYFCKDYNPASADQDLGLPLQLTYNPTSDASYYPARSSMKDTYAQILSDINKAAELVSTEGEQSCPYISVDAIKGLRARIALQMDDYATASQNAVDVIATGNYQLIDDPDEYNEMWLHDAGTETIWQIMMNENELGAKTGTLFCGEKMDNPDDQKRDYIPTQSLIDLYDQDNDIRFGAYFEKRNMTVPTGANGPIYSFNKYPGNDQISTKYDAQYVNMSKVIRLSEMYLIAAEAYCKLGDFSNGSKYLNELKKARINGFKESQLSSETILMSAIQEERHRELVGEGYRFSDLKRWGLGINRGATQNDALVNFPGSTNTTALRKDADDYRFVWPIPKAETDANPQIKGQQNPGY